MSAPSRSTKGLPTPGVNLADLLRQLGRPGRRSDIAPGFGVLPARCRPAPCPGLLLTRKGDKAAALTEFVEAARLAPDNARYAYVHAIAVDSAGKGNRRWPQLRNANKRHPNDLDIPGALLAEP